MRRWLKEAEQALASGPVAGPAGVAARSLEECIALQAKAADRYDPAMARLIANLDLLAKGRMADLRRICGVDEEDLADMVRELRAYDPKPGCRFVSKEPEAITPDVFVRRTQAGWLVELNNAALPRVLVNRRYHAELKRGPQDKASKAWLDEMPGQRQLAGEGARPTGPDDRQGGDEIVKQQQGFFEQGVSALRSR